MDHSEKQKLAAEIIKRGKTLAPDRFPKPTPEIIDTWAHELLNRHYPPQLWAEAVSHWVDRMDTGRMVTTGKLKEAAKTVWDQWGRDPRKKPAIDAWYDTLRDERDQQLKTGTFATKRGYKQLPPTPKPAVDPERVQKLIQNALQRTSRQ